VDVILREDVDSLGLRGDVVHVARGYARNFLLPRGLAQVATPALVKEIEKRDAFARRQEAKSVEDARAIARRVEALELRFDVNAGPTGSLFGSVTATNVADRLWEQEKIRVDRRKVSLQAIKRVGRYAVPVELFPDVVAEVRIAVAPAGQEPPSAEATAEAAAEVEAAAEAARAETEVDDDAGFDDASFDDADSDDAEPDDAEPHLVEQEAGASAADDAGLSTELA